MIERPVFLVGAERSGTTMLRLMLDHHPAIAFASESEYMVDWVTDDGCFPPIETYREHLAADRIFQAGHYHFDPNLNYPELVNSFLVQRRDRSGKPLVGATVHRSFDRLLHIWPDARFLHIIRDPRDVARSVIGMGWAGNVWTGLAKWLEAEQCWNRLQARLLPDRLVELKFEDLLKNPPGELARCCALFGLEYDPRMLSYPERSTYEAPDPTLSYQWRRKLSEREVQLVEARVGSLLTDRGYEPSGLPPIEVTPGLQRRLRWQDRRYRVAFRMKRYGLKLYTEDFLARRLGGPDRWREDVRQRIHQVDRAYLK